MLTTEVYLNHWREHYGNVDVPESELTVQFKHDALYTVGRANMLLGYFGEERGIVSGWRPVEVNRLVPGAAAFSNHIICRAVDLADPEGDLDDWCLEHLDKLEEVGLWMEHPAATKGWCHVQTCAPKSGKRVFYP